MSEQEYATLHRHPDEEYIAENLAKRIEEEARNERERALREQLEEHLRRQADISGGEARERAGQGDLNGSRPREPRVPRSLEFPDVPPNLIFRGSTDLRQSADFIREWTQLSLYVQPEYKVAHLLTALSDPVKHNLEAALRTSRFNAGQGYDTALRAPISTIAEWLKETYDRPDHVYRTVIRYINLKMQNSQTLEQFLRERDKVGNVLNTYGIMLDEKISKSMLVAAVTEPIRRDLMREKQWFDMSEREVIVSMKTKTLAVSSAAAGGHSQSGGQHHGQQRGGFHHLQAKRPHNQQLMVATADTITPGNNFNNHGGRGPRPKMKQPFSMHHFLYSTRNTPKGTYRRPQTRATGSNRVGVRPPINRQPQRERYNLRDRQSSQKLGNKHMRQHYHPAVWAKRCDPRTGRVLPTAQPWIPANRQLYNKDVDQQGRKFCIVCQETGHDLTTCSVAHSKWKAKNNRQ